MYQMLNKAKIMVVDDNEHLRKTMERVLNLKGYEVVTASIGSEALEKARLNQDLNIIFWAIEISVMDSVEVHKQLKIIIPGVVVILITDYAAEDLIKQALDEEVHSFVYKPLELDYIANLIVATKNASTQSRVLVVEDNEELQTKFKMILEEKGHSVVIAENGEDAIEAAINQPFDILLIDVKLPSINVLQTYSAIKKIQKEAVCILICGDLLDINSLVNGIMESYDYSYLHKPFDMVQVFMVIDDILTINKEGS